MTPAEIEAARLARAFLAAWSAHDADALARLRARLDGQTAPDGTPAGPRRTLLLLAAAETPEGRRIVAARNTDVAPEGETLLAEGDALSPVRHSRGTA